MKEHWNNQKLPRVQGSGARKLDTVTQQLTFKTILKFWSPLAATWLMMAVEGPYLAAIIARLPDPKQNLAAYGVAFSLALIVESPIIMLVAAVVALVKNKVSYLRMRTFAYALNVFVTIVMLLFLLTPLFTFVTQRLMKLPPEIADLIYGSTLLLLPWPGAIGFRRFYQGILIANNLTKRVSYGTMIRLLSMTVTAGILSVFTDLPGAYVGTAALSFGVVAEALASRAMVHRSLVGILTENQAWFHTRESNPAPSYKEIINFYYPLALSSMISLSVGPFVTFFMGRSRFPLESLAILPVVNSVQFIFSSLGLSYQEVGIALLGKDFKGYKPVRNFALTLSGCLTVLFGLLAFTPLARIWLLSVSGLSPELARFSMLPLQLTTPLPGLMVWLSLQRAVMLNAGRTYTITLSTLIEFSSIGIVLISMIHGLSAIGAVAATSSFVIGRSAAAVYFIHHHMAILRNLRAPLLLQAMKPV